MHAPLHRTLPFVVALGLLALAGCDAMGSDASDALTQEGTTANSVTCSAPSLSSTTSGGYIQLTGFGWSGGVFETADYQSSNWWNEGTSGSTTYLTNYRPHDGGPFYKLDVRARNICYNSSTDTYSFSGLSNKITLVIDGLQP